MKTSFTTPMLLLISAVSLFSFLASGADPDPVQDFCVSVNDTSTPGSYVNGKWCKDPKTVTADDFYYAGGLDRPHDIESPLGTKVSMAFERQLPGLNTQGLAMSRLDFAPRGLNPAHLHPRASEMIVVLNGTLYTGIITSNPPDPNENNTLFEKVLHPGDTFVYPRGLIHFQYNIGNDSAVAMVFFNSQNPGVISLGKAVFGSEPPVLPPVVARGFQIDDSLVEYLQSLTWMGNN